MTNERTSMTSVSRDPIQRRYNVPGTVTALLVAAATILAFGVQQVLYQGEQNNRDVCTQEWGEAVIDTLSTRTGATARLDQARQDRDDALDSFLLVLTGTGRIDRNDPGFRRVLAEFAQARSRLDRVEARVTQTRESTPYPVLDCN